jgi:hypothetical protein
VQIRFKDGKPLLVGGQVAGSQTCCCENPPPPACYCPDSCSYFFEVTSPTAVAVKSRAVDCLGFGGGTSIKFANEWLFPGISYLPGWTTCARYTQPFYNSMASDGSGVSVSFAGVFCNPDNEYDYIEVSGRALIFFACYDGSGGFTGTPAVSVYWRVRAERRLVPIGGYYYLTHSIAFAQAGGMVYPSTFCQYNDKRSCGPPAGISMPPNGFKYINTPLTLELSRSSVSVNGSTQSLDPEDFQSFANYGYDASSISAFVSEIADAFTATFRITSRPSCKPTGCACGQSLAGISLQLYGQTFIVGNEPDPDRTLGNEVWNYTDSTMSPVIEYTVWDAFFLEEQYKVVAEVFCESEPQADGNVGPAGEDAWYLIIYSDCFEWEGGVVVSQTRDTYVGVYDCYEHCDKFLPSGTPPEMYLVSSVTTPGLDSCSPMAATPIVIDFVECPE